MRYRCYVCNENALDGSPYSSRGVGSGEICPNCGFQYGIDDYPDKAVNMEQWRKERERRGFPSYRFDSVYRNMINKCHAAGVFWPAQASAEELRRPLLLNKIEMKKVWDWIYDTCHFSPSTDVGIVPFKLNFPHVVFTLGSYPDEKNEIVLQRKIMQCLFACTDKNEMVYALEWQSSCYLFNPHNPPTELNWLQTEGKDTYLCSFPFFYPDGDYYFFLAKDFHFGYFGHPWRREVWVFGDRLMNEVGKVAPLFGWVKKEGL